MLSKIPFLASLVESSRLEWSRPAAPIDSVAHHFLDEVDDMLPDTNDKTRI